MQIVPKQSVQTPNIGASAKTDSSRLSDSARAWLRSVVIISFTMLAIVSLLRSIHHIAYEPIASYEDVEGRIVYALSYNRDYLHALVATALSGQFVNNPVEFHLFGFTLLIYLFSMALCSIAFLRSQSTHSFEYLVQGVFATIAGTSLTVFMFFARGTLSQVYHNAVKLREKRQILQNESESTQRRLLLAVVTMVQAFVCVLEVGFTVNRLSSLPNEVPEVLPMYVFNEAAHCIVWPVISICTFLFSWLMIPPAKDFTVGYLWFSLISGPLRIVHGAYFGAVTILAGACASVIQLYIMPIHTTLSLFGVKLIEAESLYQKLTGGGVCNLIFHLCAAAFCCSWWLEAGYLLLRSSGSILLITEALNAGAHATYCLMTGLWDYTGDESKVHTRSAQARFDVFTYGGFGILACTHVGLALSSLEQKWDVMFNFSVVKAITGVLGCFARLPRVYRANDSDYETLKLDADVETSINIKGLGVEENAHKARKWSARLVGLLAIAGAGFIILQVIIFFYYVDQGLAEETGAISFHYSFMFTGISAAMMMYGLRGNLDSVTLGIILNGIMFISAGLYSNSWPLRLGFGICGFTALSLAASTMYIRFRLDELY